MNIRKGDTVVVRIGKNRSVRGKVDRVLSKDNRIVVTGVNTITKHVKASQGMRQAGRIQQEAPIHISNVTLVCDKCNNPTRSNVKFLDDGKKVRVCRKCKEAID